MIPAPSNRKNDPRKRLVHLFRQLAPEQQENLLEFAEFLASRAPQRPREIPDPVPQPRSEGESVVKAIRRLSATYPMLDKSRMLNQTSSLVAQHVMQGRDAAEVIEKLEVVFETHYRQLVVEFEQSAREEPERDSKS